MQHKREALKLFLAMAVSATAIVSDSRPTVAGGFFVRDQSTQFLGTVFAGNAAGGALSSMFWNPAAIGQFNGIWSESAFTAFLPQSEIHALPGSTLVDGVPFGTFPSDSGDIGRNAVIPASYFSYQFSKDVVFGLSINSPFGLGTETRQNWAGQTLGRKGKLESYNATPTVAYRVAPGFTLGAGLQVQYFRAKLVQAIPAMAVSWPSATIKADDIAVGFTLGALWQLGSGTSVGLGFRSSIDHDLEGSLGTPGFGKSRLTADAQLPEIVTLSLRHDLTPKWTALGTVEWSNWSRLGKIDYVCRPVGAVCADTLELGWHDGWFFAAGLEYDYNEKLTLRGGVAYEIAPIQNADERLVLLPDTNRLTLSVGASYDLKWCASWCDGSSMSIAYAHSFPEDGRINRTEGTLFPLTLVANTQASVDLISIGFKTQWSGGGQAAARALK